MSLGETCYLTQLKKFPRRTRTFCVVTVSSCKRDLGSSRARAASAPHNPFSECAQPLRWRGPEESDDGLADLPCTSSGSPRLTSAPASRRTSIPWKAPRWPFEQGLLSNTAPRFPTPSGRHLFDPSGIPSDQTHARRMPADDPSPVSNGGKPAAEAPRVASGPSEH